VTVLRYLSGGESHGRALTAIIEGLPAGIVLDEDRINAQLQRRQGGFGRGGRMEIEKDRVRFLSGVRGGKTLGSPVTGTGKTGRKLWLPGQGPVWLNGL